MNIDQLPYIIAIASAGSLSGAAKQLGISQSTLSKYLSGLEKDLGLPLFSYRDKRMYPTKAGRAYIGTARKILDILRSTQSDISQIDQESSRSLRVGISRQIGVTIFSRLYLEFHTQFPGVKLLPVEGYADELKMKLKNQDCDLIFTSGEEHPEFDFCRYARSEIVLAIPDSLRTAALPQDEVTDLSCLSNFVFVLPEPPNALYPYVQSILKTADFAPQVAFSTPNLSMAREFIAAGTGIGFLQDYHIAGNSALRALHLNPRSYISTGCFTNKGAVITPEMRYLQFLWLKYSLSNSGVDWNPYIRSLISEFAPDIISGMYWEDAT